MNLSELGFLAWISTPDGSIKTYKPSENSASDDGGGGFGGDEDDDDDEDDVDDQGMTTGHHDEEDFFRGYGTDVATEDHEDNRMDSDVAAREHLSMYIKII